MKLLYINYKEASENLKTTFGNKQVKSKHMKPLQKAGTVEPDKSFHDLKQLLVEVESQLSRWNLLVIAVESYGAKPDPPSTNQQTSTKCTADY